MTDTTQPPAETLAECPFCGADAIWREYDPAKPDVVSGLVVNHSPECFLSWSSPVRDDQSIRAAWNKRPALTRRADGDAVPNSWSRSAEDTRAMALLLAEVELHLQSSRIFITTREKMHTCGVDLHDELAVKVTAALDNLGREDGDARR